MSGGSSHSARRAGATASSTPPLPRAELLRLAGLLASPGAFPKGTRSVIFASSDRAVLAGAIPGELDALLGYRLGASENIPEGFAVALGHGGQFIGILDLRGRAPAAEEKLSPLSPQLSTPRKLREP